MTGVDPMSAKEFIRVRSLPDADDRRGAARSRRSAGGNILLPFPSAGSSITSRRSDASRIWLGWIGLRAALITACIGLWLLNRKRTLIRAIVLTNAVLTVGLILNVVALSATLMGFSARDISVLLVDVVDMAASNILIFSIWYWLIDPPGIDATPGADRAWEFLLPAASKPPTELRYVDARVPRLRLSFVHDDACLQPHRCAAPHSAGEDADAPASDGVRGYPDMHRRQRNQHTRGWFQVR